MDLTPLFIFSFKMNKRKKNIIKHIFFAGVIFLIILPAIQAYHGFIKIEPLYGGFNSEEKPSLKWFMWERWFNETFQKKFNKAIEDNLGFRNFFIRLNNQINYSLYGVCENPNIVIGHNDCIFEEGYILAYLGRNFIGKDLINERIRRTKWVQDYLKKEKNIDLIIVFEPGKGTYHAENIPARYRPWDKQLSNYDYYVQRCKETGVKYIDLSSYFMAMKDTSKYPLFPLYGVHWGTYGMVLAADTIMKYIEGVRHIDMPDFDWSDIEVTNQNKDVDVDWDAEHAMNLLYRLPYATMAYPKIKFINDSNKTKPRVITVADSYYWSMYNSGIPQHCFKDHQFWYYYYQIYPYIWDDSHLVNTLNARQEIEKQDVILVMCTEMNLYRADWQLSDDMYKWYCLEYKEDKWYNARNAVIDQDHWLQNHISIAKKLNISVEEAIDIDARIQLYY
jgi:hypothetical protein